MLPGELTGHCHVIDLSPQIKSLNNLLLSDEAPTAILYEDKQLASNLVEDIELCIGFLEIKGSPFILKHSKAGLPTEEHDAIRVPAGTYYVGRQREFSSEHRLVKD